MSEKPLVMVAASASGILGEYDHSFKFEADSDFVILYGPNGIGKTKFLEIIHALSQLSEFRLSRLPFGTASIKYSDGTVLSVSRKTKSRELENDADFDAGVQFLLRRSGHDVVKYNVVPDEFVDFIRSRGLFEQVSDDLWRDTVDGEIASTTELRARYGALSRRSEPTNMPPEFAEFISRIPSFLIETQRLRIDDQPRRSRGALYRESAESRSVRPRIVEQSDKILELLNEAQTSHSRITQRLDRTFPNRVLTAAREERHRDAKLIRKRYDSQNEFRSRLGSVASVALTEELSLQEGQLDAWALALLELYLDDAEKKLEPFTDLLEKIELLEKIVNTRLLNKRLEVTDRDGLAVKHSETGRTIELDSLSSGEQHEIILLMDLLFHVPQGAVVLIDEPEISLHIAWQLAFIPDVVRIAEQVGFRFVVATHSPQIINDKWDRAVRLGPPEVSFA